MCIHIEYCPKCNNETDSVFRIAQDDEEKSLAYNEETCECECGEIFRFANDKPCEDCHWLQKI